MGRFFSKKVSIVSSAVLLAGCLSLLTSQGEAKPKTKPKPAQNKSTKPPGPSVTPNSLPNKQSSKIPEDRTPIDPDAPPAIEDPTGTALNSFFEALQLAEAGYPGGRVLISQFGDSHTAADFGTSRLRRVMQERFGDAGRGIVWPGKPVKYYSQRDANFEQSGEWHNENGLRGAAIEPFGIMGMRNTTVDPKASFSVSNCEQCPLKTTSRFEVFYLRKDNGGKMNIALDDKPLVQVDTKLNPNQSNPTGYFIANVEDAPHKLTISSTNADPLEFFGVVMERDKPGVIVDALGVGGVEISALVRWNWDFIGEQLQRRDPSLVIIHYGTNESANPSLSITKLEENFVTIIKRIKQTTPQASILVMGPIDRTIRERKDCDVKKVVKKGKKKTTVKTPKEIDGEIPEGCDWKTPLVIPEIVEAERRAALREGVAFFDTYQAMGGSGSMDYWFKQTPAMGGKDHTHLNKLGYETVSDMLYAALMQEYDRYLINSANQPDESLDGTFTQQ
jgi:lysophospholipase L1-like esterase